MHTMRFALAICFTLRVAGAQARQSPSQPSATAARNGASPTKLIGKSR